MFNNDKEFKMVYFDSSIKAMEKAVSKVDEVLSNTNDELLKKNERLLNSYNPEIYIEWYPEWFTEKHV